MNACFVEVIVNGYVDGVCLDTFHVFWAMACTMFGHSSCFWAMVDITQGSGGQH
jgi:hypothetical protein